MWIAFLVLFFGALSIEAQVAWVSRGTVARHQEYTTTVLQEMIYEIERRGFSMLTLDEYSQTFNTTLYTFPVVGTARYTNGFVVSIQKIDLTNYQQSVSNTNVNGVSTPFASTRCRLNLHDVKLGFDVITDIGGEGEQRYTGTYTHVLIQYDISLLKNLITNELSTSSSLLSLSGGSGIRMIYMPANNITEAISRSYLPSNNWNAGAGVWPRTVFAPILADIISNIDFPEICFNYNC